MAVVVSAGRATVASGVAFRHDWWRVAHCMGSRWQSSMEEACCAPCRGEAMTFTVPIKTVSEANSHTHWRARQRRAKSQREAVYVVALAEKLLYRSAAGCRLPVDLPAVVTLTRIAPLALDCDNLPSSMKHCRDELAAMIGLPNDRDPRVKWAYAQEKCKRGGEGVRVDIQPRGT